MKKFLSSIKSPASDDKQKGAATTYAPPPGAPPTPQSAQFAAGSAQQYYGQYAPPPGPPPPLSSATRPAGHAGQVLTPTTPMPVGQSGEDPLTALRKYDTVILVDDSGSMEMFWDETRDALQGVVDVSIRYDEDGIDLHFFNDTSVSKHVNSVQQVSKVFRRIDPRRSTPTATALHRVLEPYVAQLELAKSNPSLAKPKPLNLIVLTDGAPDRGQDPEPVLVDIAKRLDTIRAPLFQLGVNFIQIGTDEEAAAHLATLDDDLKTKHKVRDFVDATPYQGHITSEFILKALLGGINRRVDKNPL